MGNDVSDSDLLSLAAKVAIGGLIVGAIILLWIGVFGPLFNQVSYDQFNGSPQHINAVVQKFTDDCEQLAQTSDPTAKKAIEQDIAYEAATINVDTAQMPDSVRICVQNALHDVNTHH